MEARERRVLYYQTASKTSPFKDWRDVLVEDVRVIVDARIARLRGGNFGDSRPIGGGASENRIHFGPGYRIYYGVDGADLIILLCGGDKSTQTDDIACAQRCWVDYKERKRRLAKTKANR